MEQWKPASETELQLVEEMASSVWRQRRLLTVETALLDHEICDQEETIKDTYERIDDGVCLALAWKALADNSGALVLLSRYEARYRRSYERALKLLMELQDRRKAEEAKPAEEVAAEQQKCKNEPNPKNEHPPQPPQNTAEYPRASFEPSCLLPPPPSVPPESPANGPDPDRSCPPASPVQPVE
jgi:hypothetical protein